MIHASVVVAAWIRPLRIAVNRLGSRLKLLAPPVTEMIRSGLCSFERESPICSEYEPLEFLMAAYTALHEMLEELENLCWYSLVCALEKRDCLLSMRETCASEKGLILQHCH